MTKLNKARLRKVRTLMERGATEGEREAARQTAEAMAAKAGCSLDEAFAYADRSEANEAVATGTMSSMFEALFNTPEMKASRARREQERAEARDRLVGQYGSAEAVMAETESERALREAVAHLAVHKAYIDEDGTVHRYVSTLDGWNSHSFGSDLPQSVREAVSSALPMPASVAEAYDELRAIDQLRIDRSQFELHYEPSIEVLAREYVVEAVVQTMPGKGCADIEARFAWARWMDERGLFQDCAKAFLDRTETDVLNLIIEDSGMVPC